MEMHKRSMIWFLFCTDSFVFPWLHSYILKVIKVKLCMLDESWICQKALHHPLLQHNMLCCLVMFLQGISCNAMPFWLTDIYVSCRHWLERNGWETLIQMFLKSQFLISLLNLIWECILDRDMIESLLYSMITDAIFTFLSCNWNFHSEFKGDENRICATLENLLLPHLKSSVWCAIIFWDTMKLNPETKVERKV